ncbi:type IV pilus biogenesis/stability protein PilW [Marinimicrobium agarilyticum]|uniref:type IV pilus biogenesis/stability protein PilW n=1 Tax=Marinimicrobium agarilyticum TaxID=306546 RepID=UPI00041813F8|nr:type IV pilus biogenesis/stability protein PilW [Marinimicrobium agarilyticum]
MIRTATNLLTLIRTFCLAVFCLGLFGCVTQTTGGDIDREAALETHYKLALAYLDNRNRDSARHHIQKIFELNDDSAKGFAAQAVLFQLEGEVELAETRFKRALKEDPNFSQARNNYAAFLYQQGRYEDAFEQFAIVSRDLNYDNRARALLSLGRAALELGRDERAKAAFEHAYNLDPKMAAVLVELAAISFQEQEYSKTKEYLDQYSQIARQSARTLLLGIKIERIFGNKDKEASYANALKNRFPYSDEYLEYKRELSQ